MKKVLLASLALGLLTTVLPVTQAEASEVRHQFRGSCTFATTNDTSPTEPFGGQAQWTGEAAAVVVATTADDVPAPTAAISFQCNVWRNGTTNLGTILSGAGMGMASDADATFTFTAEENDTISVCQEVTVAGDTHGSATTFNSAWCEDSERTATEPGPVGQIEGDGDLSAVISLDGFFRGCNWHGIASATGIEAVLDGFVVTVKPAVGTTIRCWLKYADGSPVPGTDTAAGAPGPAAATAKRIVVPFVPTAVCMEVHMLYVDGSSSSDRTPECEA